jgi:hypothetical protein
LQGASIETIIQNTERVVTRGRLNGGNLGFVTRDDQLRRSPLVSIGYSDVESSYYSGYDKCVGAGEFVIGWNSAIHGAPDEPICQRIGYRPESFRVRPGGRIGPRNPPQALKTLQGLSPRKSIIASGFYQYYRNPRNADASSLQYYCNALSPAEGAWGVAISNTSLSGGGSGLQEELDRVLATTCRQAQDTCLEQGGSECSVVSEDIWRTDFPSNLTQFKEVDLLLTCSNIDRPYSVKSGVSREDIVAGLAQLEAAARQENAQSCTFNIQYFYDVQITPASSERTLIRTGLSEDSYVIDDLVGSITIQRPGTQEESVSVTLNPGDRFLIESLDPQNTADLSKIIPRESRTELIDKPVVQAFLDKDRWPQDLGPEIDAYWAALREQFLPQPPAVRVERRSVNGINVVVAEVDLNNPSTVLTLEPEASVRAVGSVRDFAASRNAALVLSGTFGDPGRVDPNWSVMSEGRFIQGENAQNWSTYTVLGLKRNNEPEMVPRSSGPAWSEFWFALTGHPRLVNNGVAGITEVVPNATLNIDGPASRAAIGFSSSSKTLFHVITDNGVSVTLPEMATVMREIGCDNAMNLEGGGGFFIVHEGQRYGPGEVRAPVIVVYDPEHPPNAQVEAAWNRF